MCLAPDGVLGGGWGEEVQEGAGGGLGVGEGMVGLGRAVGVRCVGDGSEGKSAGLGGWSGNHLG